MNDALLVSRFHCFRDLLGDWECLVERDRSLRNTVRKRWSLDQLHHEGLDAVTLFKAVNLADVGMVQRGERAGLALEPGQTFAIVCESLRQDFNRDVALELRVPRPIHLPHSALAEQRSDFVRAEFCADGDGQSTTSVCLALTFVDCIYECATEV